MTVVVKLQIANWCELYYWTFKTKIDGSTFERYNDRQTKPASPFSLSDLFSQFCNYYFIHYRMRITANRNFKTKTNFNYNIQVLKGFFSGSILSKLAGEITEWVRSSSRSSYLYGFCSQIKLSLVKNPNKEKF